MDLMTIAARLFLDTDDYTRGLDDASRSASDFSASLERSLAGAAGAFSSLSSAAPGWGVDMMQGFIDGIRRMWGSLTQTVSAVAQTVRSYLGFSEPEVGPLSDFHTYAPDMMALYAKGIRENAHLVSDQLEESLDVAPAPSGPFPLPRTVSEPREAQRPIQIVFELDGVQKFVYRLNKAEEQRVGVKLAGVTV